MAFSGGMQPAAAEDPLYKILVGVDGSADSRAALVWAVQEAQRLCGTVEALCVWYESVRAVLNAPSLYIPAEITLQAQERLHAEIGAVRQRLGPEYTVGVNEHVVEGNPTEVLVEASRDADLLVLGATGTGRFRYSHPREVARDCVLLAHCPVVLVRETDVPRRRRGLLLRGSKRRVRGDIAS